MVGEEEPEKNPEKKREVLGTWYRCVHCGYRVYSKKKMGLCPKCKRFLF